MSKIFRKRSEKVGLSPGTRLAIWLSYGSSGYVYHRSWNNDLCQEEKMVVG